MRVIDAGYVFEDDNGNPLSGGRVYFYTSGTATLKATYSDIARTVQNANPLTISADGRLSVDVFGNGSYRVRVADANGSTIWTEDDVSLSQIILPSYTTATRPSSHGTVPALIYDSTLGKTMMWNGSAWVDTFGSELPSEATLRADLASTASTSYGASLVAYKRIGDTGAVATTVYSKLRDVVSVKDFGAVGDGVTDDTAAIQAAFDSIVRGIIHVPSGDYLSTNIKLKPKLTWAGDGIEVSFFRLSGAGNLVTSDVTNNSYCSIRDMSLRGDGSTAGQRLMYVTGAYSSFFEKVLFLNSETLVHLIEGEGQTVFRDCILRSAGDNGYALRLENVREVVVDNTPIEDSASGVYATRSNAVFRLKFHNIHVEDVGKVFNFVASGSYTGGVTITGVDANGVGNNLANPADGYLIQTDGEMLDVYDLKVEVADAATPIIKTSNWSILAKDCPSFSANDATTAFIQEFHVGLGNAYIPAAKRSILDSTVALSSLYTATSNVSVSTASNTGAFTSTGSGQWRIRPVTTAPVAYKAIMVRFEFKSTLTAALTMSIDNMGGQMICYSGSTVTRSVNSIKIPSSSGAWTKAYLFISYTAEFDQSARFFYGTLPSGDTLEFRNFEIFECNRPPYNILDW